MTHRRSRPNPRPAAWDALPPGTPYACKSAYLGRVLPGRGGGTVTACATPARDYPKEGQLAVGTRGRLIRRTVAKTRLRDAARAPCDRAHDRALSAAMLAAWRQNRAAAMREGTYIPAPPEYDFPHRQGQGVGCHYSPTWQSLRDAQRDLYEEGVDDPRDQSAALQRRREWATWVRKEEKALDEWTARVRARRGTGGLDSTARVAARHRADAVRRGEDVTDKGYLESRGGGEGAARKAAKKPRKAAKKPRKAAR